MNIGRPRATAVLTDAELAQVRALVDAQGVRGAGKALGLDQRTVLALLAKVGVSAGNAELARRRLAEGVAAAPPSVPVQSRGRRTG